MYEQGAGQHLVHTFGARACGDTGSWNRNLEAALQKGRFAGRPGLAWGIATEVGRRFGATPLRPALNMAFDIVSGDRDGGDTRLGTFNPIFPNAK